MFEQDAWNLLMTTMQTMMSNYEVSKNESDPAVTQEPDQFIRSRGD